MSGSTERGSGAAWGAAGWSAGVAALLVGLPLVARGRLPERLATHWGGGGRPDGSMPLWAAVVFPALVWMGLALCVVLGWRRAGGATRGWVGATLGSAGLLLVGAQASIVRANLDRQDWREAGSVTGGALVAIGVAAGAGVVAWFAGRDRSAAGGRAAEGPRMEIPQGRRLVWFSRTSSPWLHAVSALAALVAVAAVLAWAGGLAGPNWSLIAPTAFVSLVLLECASVRTRVSEAGFEVSFGPFGLPVRRWAVRDIEAARVEHRTPAQAGGWGYRLNGLGTTVMLRGGECLVVRARGRDFAVSVDDAERGAALLNSLRAQV
ncbi:DUF1648 domain-containing protein [Streptomyces sp. NPDC020403]|uniref:DUF1648 domain-containing protein n=1 Tax=unclassified Streptomyces TaxID=2593676 RepID=UPI0033F6A5FE